MIIKKVTVMVMVRNIVGTCLEKATRIPLKVHD